MQFLPDSGDGGATVEELVEDHWSDKHGQGQMFEGLHCKVEPDLDTVNTEAALDRLLENGVVRDSPSAKGAGMKHLTPDGRKPGGNATVSGSTKFRFVGREHRWQEFREDLFAPGASYYTGRIVDILSLKTSCAHFHSGHQAPELDDLVFEPPEVNLNRLRAAGMSTNIWWKLQKQLPGRVDHFTSALVDKLGFTRCVSAPQFFWNPDRHVEMEVPHG